MFLTAIFIYNTIFCSGLTNRLHVTQRKNKSYLFPYKWCWVELTLRRTEWGSPDCVDRALITNSEQGEHCS